MSSYDVLVIGDVNADLIVSLSEFPLPSNDLNVRSVIPASRYTLYPGGMGLTVALTLAKLGLKTGIISSIGREQIGHFLMKILKEKNIDISHVKKMPNSTMIIMLEDSQKKRVEIVCKGERKLTSMELDSSFLLSAKMIFVVGHFFTSEDMADLITDSLNMTKRAGKINLMDPGKFYLYPNIASKIKDSLKNINVLLPNFYELKKLTGKDSISQALETLKEIGVETIAVKMGEEGCYIYSKGKEQKIPPFKVKVKDVIGAGDTFNGAFMYGLLRKWDFVRIARFANAAAALKIQMERNSFPTLNEILAFLDHNECS